jgi:hypothetical protein
MLRFSGRSLMLTLGLTVATISLSALSAIAEPVSPSPNETKTPNNSHIHHQMTNSCPACAENHENHSLTHSQMTHPCPACAEAHENHSPTQSQTTHNCPACAETQENNSK